MIKPVWRVKCPNGHHCRANVTWAGRRVRCQRCDTRFYLPDFSFRERLYSTTDWVILAIVAVAIILLFYHP